MKVKFTDLPRPLLVGSLRHADAARTIADIKASELDGARAFILHIQRLDEEYRRPEELRRVFASTRYPVMAINYRREGGASDEQRVELLLDAVRVGASCIDLPADTFDGDSRRSLEGCSLPFAAADPSEVSMRSDCVAKQKQTIEKVRALGAQVLLSAHCLQTHLNRGQALSLALEMESRGPDMIKIVTNCPTVDHAMEMLLTVVALKRKLRVPFVYICTGPHGELVRPMAPLLGAMLVFGHHDYTERSNTSKQLLANMREFYRMIPWRMNEYPE